ncbi:MAG TPA: TIGR03435 family protein, partial [Bryobacteraceae bacterium]|nr:TIGR03435 family protein [Bryobacteraceae bacterium]
MAGMKAALLVVLAIPLVGQTPGGFTFEVASIKLNTSHPDGNGITTGQGGLTTENTSLFALVRHALGVQEYQISGGPAWVRDLGFDINARNNRDEEADIPDSDRKGQEARSVRMRSRLLNLLEERFQLKLREEEKELPVYSLTVEKTGHKLKAPAGKIGSVSSSGSNTAGSVRGEGVDLSRLCMVLSDVLQRPVVDETGLDGIFDVELKYTLDDSASTKDAAELVGPSIFTAQRQQLGLRLAGKKGPVTTYVIERAEKPGE